jgi:hypothetical protein
MDAMNYWFRKCFAIILLLAAVQADTASEALARGASFSFDSVWFYRDGTRVVPEISRRWLTVVFSQRYLTGANDLEPASDTENSFIRKKARAIVKSQKRLTGYLYDPNLAEDACFFRIRNGARLEDVRQLVRQLSQDGTVAYVHPTVIVDNRTFAFFNAFEMQWKTGTPEAERKSLLRATHAAVDENDEKENRYTVDVARIPYFKALNLLAEDVRALRVTPRLVEVKPSISAKLSLFMSGGNIGDSIPFRLTIDFSDRVNIDPSSIATLNLRPQELQKELFDCTFDPYDYVKAVTKSPIVITGRVAFYAPGEYSLPAVKVSYSCPSCSDTNVRSVETEPVLFKVSSIIPKVASENRLIVPTDPVAPGYALPALHQQSLRYLSLVIICFAGLVPCALWAFRLRPRVSAERDRLEERKKAVQLAGRLRVLLLTTPPAPHWSYLGDVGALLREYLTVLYGIDSRYRGGSGKRFMATLGEQVPPECLGTLGGILSSIDDGVALEAEQWDDLEQLQRDILSVVDLTARNGAAQG